MMKLRLAPLVFLASLGSPLLPAQDAAEPADSDKAYREAAASIDEDLRNALDELAQVRAAIAAEKPVIAAEANRIAADLREKRRRSEIARVSREAAEAEFEKTEADLNIWREERAYIEGLLLDFRKTREVTSGPAGERLPANADLSARLDLVDRVVEELGNTGSAITFQGEAVAPDGTLSPGTFAKLGPVSWFLSEAGGPNGLVVDGPDLRPRLVRSPVADTSVAALVRGEATAITFDPTLGSAVALTESDTTLLEHIRQGGFWIYPILLLAAVALLTTLFKWFQLSRIRDFGTGPVRRILDALNRDEAGAAKSEAAALRHPARAILEQGIAFVETAPQASRDDLEEALYEKYLEAVPRLQRGLPLIAIASATAPLLGLLGTVTGMIETFKLINIFGTGDAKSLASGISEALVTTEFGLIVAIPALILHALLSRKVQGIKAVMEMTSLAFLNGIKSK